MNQSNESLVVMAKLLTYESIAGYVELPLDAPCPTVRARGHADGWGCFWIEGEPAPAPPGELLEHEPSK